MKSKHRDWLAIDIAFKGSKLYPPRSDYRRKRLWLWAKKYGMVRGWDRKYTKKDYPHFQDNWKPLSFVEIIMSKYKEIFEKEVDRPLFSKHDWDTPLSEKDVKYLLEIIVARAEKRMREEK